MRSCCPPRTNLERNPDFLTIRQESKGVRPLMSGQSCLEFRFAEPNLKVDDTVDFGQRSQQGPQLGAAELFRSGVSLNGANI